MLCLFPHLCLNLCVGANGERMVLVPPLQHSPRQPLADMLGGLEAALRRSLRAHTVHCLAACGQMTVRADVNGPETTAHADA